MITLIIGAALLMMGLILAQEVRIAKTHKQLKRVEHVIHGELLNF